MPGPTAKITITFGVFQCTIEGVEDAVEATKDIADHLQKLSERDRGFGATPTHSVTDRDPPLHPADPTSAELPSSGTPDKVLNKPSIRPDRGLSGQNMGEVIAKARDALNTPEVAARRNAQKHLKAATSRAEQAPDPQQAPTISQAVLPPEVYEKFPEFCAGLSLCDDADILEAAAVYLQEHHWHSPASARELAQLLRAYDEEGYDSEELQPALASLIEANRLERTPGGGYALTRQTRFRDRKPRAR